MKKIAFLSVLIFNLYSSYGQIIGPTEVEESVTVTYENPEYTGDPNLLFYWIIESGQTSYTCEDSVNHSWDTPGFYKVELRVEEVQTSEDYFVASLDVVVGDPPFIEYKYDNAGNRTSREVIYYSERKAGLKNFKGEPDNKEEEIESMEGIHLFPNPAKDMIQISVNKDVLEEDNRRIIIYDMQGRKVRDKMPQSNVVEINVSDMSHGSYIVKLIYGKRVKDWMLIKQ